ncbi:hypothetical protein ACH5RR_005959 [Cinchona calisaya]|uniref:Regulator of Vps4 activity in the MVB pathway protein n=1 Tax=Cinchona calisaya TaxID=153742 RepID=A0ABD3AMN1_9GENT
MLDGLLNRGFSSKSKSLIKATRTRIEVERRRPEAKQRFLKEDLAKLLANGLDINAYGRTEEFLAGLDLLTCYDFIEYTCEYLVKQLSSMQKQRECPEECREAVASLMFAAARFSDLPELRDLRDLFQERYGGALECFVNQKFVEKLSSRPPITEKRLQLLKDIASEFSIKWDSRGFEHRMAAPSTLAQAQPNKHGPSTVAADKYNLLNGNESVAKSDRYDASPKEARGPSDGVNRLNNGRECKDSRREHGSVAVANFDSYDVTPKEARGLSNGGHRMHNGSEGKDSRREDRYDVAKSDSYDVSPKETRSLSNHGHRIPNEGQGKNSGREEVYLNQKARQGRSTNGHMSATEKGETTSRRVKNDKLLEGRQEMMVYEHELSRKEDDTLFKAVKSGNSSRKKKLYNVGSEYSGQDEGIGNPIDERESWKTLSPGKTKMSPGCEGFMGREGDISSACEHVREKNLLNSKKHVQEEEGYSSKSDKNSLRPPPYIKSKNNMFPPPYIKHKESKHTPNRKSEQAGSYWDGHSTDPSSCSRVNEVNESKTQTEPENPGSEGQNVGLVRVRRSRNHEKGQQYEEDKIPLPKPRSVRRKQHKSSSNHDDTANVEDVGAVKRSSSSRRRRENSRKGLQILFDDEHSRKDEEERMIDKLLLHYSKKPSTYDAGKVKKVSQVHPPHQFSNDTGESSHDRKGDGHDLSPDAIPKTMRSTSLPHEETMPSEAKKVFTRANSFQPDGQARHVHPKLPDYDDLAARFAALKDL